MSSFYFPGNILNVKLYLSWKYMKCLALFVLDLYEMLSFIYPGSQALFELEINESVKLYLSCKSRFICPGVI